MPPLAMIIENWPSDARFRRRCNNGYSTPWKSRPRYAYDPREYVGAQQRLLDAVEVETRRRSSVLRPSSAQQRLLDAVEVETVLLRSQPVHLLPATTAARRRGSRDRAISVVTIGTGLGQQRLLDAVEVETYIKLRVIQDAGAATTAARRRGSRDSPVAHAPPHVPQLQQRLLDAVEVETGK